MTTESKDKKPENIPERRQSDRPRRRLVDLTRMAGTNRREKKGRRKGDQPDNPATEQTDEKDKS